MYNYNGLKPYLFVKPYVFTVEHNNMTAAQLIGMHAATIMTKKLNLNMQKDNLAVIDIMGLVSECATDNISLDEAFDGMLGSRPKIIIFSGFGNLSKMQMPGIYQDTINTVEQFMIDCDDLVFIFVETDIEKALPSRFIDSVPKYNKIDKMTAENDYKVIKNKGGVNNVFGI